MTKLDRSIIIPAGPPIVSSDPAKQRLDAAIQGGVWRFRPGALARSISVAAPPPSVGGGPFTIVSWVTVGEANQYWLDSRKPKAGGRFPEGPGWLIGLYGRGGRSHFLLQMNRGSGHGDGSWDNFWSKKQETALENGSTHCLVATVDPAQRHIALFIDGDEELGMHDRYDVGSADISGQTLLIGNGRDAESSPANVFEGELHAFGVYNRVLSADEILSLNGLMASTLHEWNTLPVSDEYSVRERSQTPAVLTFTPPVPYTLIAGTRPGALAGLQRPVPPVNSEEFTILMWLDGTNNAAGTLLDLGDARASIRLLATEDGYRLETLQPGVDSQPLDAASAGVPVTQLGARLLRTTTGNYELSLVTNGEIHAGLTQNAPFAEMTGRPMHIDGHPGHDDPTDALVMAVLIVNRALTSAEIERLGQFQPDEDPSSWSVWAADLNGVVGSMLAPMGDNRA